jgi:hypothetical protein
MPPILAAIGCVLFILFLFYADFRRADRPSLALWVPTLWMFLIGSRHASSWLNLSPQFGSAADIALGSPIDRAVFSSLIVAGIVILFQRRIDWPRLLVRNGLIALYLLYCLTSAAWADDPALLAKRWVKELGHPIMALVILTERRPYEAIGIVLRRLAFVMLPLSILFIKYYPDLGRWYRYMGDGAATYIGVGTQKNDLGLICLITGIYLAWEFLLRRKEVHPTFLRQYKILTATLVGMLAWLLYKSNSQTALVCLIAAVTPLLLASSKVMARSPDSILGVLFFSIGALWLLDQTFNLKDTAFWLLGRQANLTERTDIWRILLGFNTDPILGVGFMTFWTGARVEEAWKLLEIQINQAHNGYLEQYLNLGYFGVAFILLLMLSTLFKARRHMHVDFAAGMLRFCFVFVAAIYNYTEASFSGNNMWMLLLLAYLEVPRTRERPAVVLDGQISRPATVRRVAKQAA